jgi:KUP system potassium uptake protein
MADAATTSSAASAERSQPAEAGGSAARAALTLGALGVVFGDIGTSPLYALQTVFSIDHGAVHPTEGVVYGVVSLVFWAITLIVSVKYVTFIMRASNDGEGSIVALTALVQRAKANTAILVLLGVFGASLFYGDGMITPAISVLSAVEGVKVAAPGLAELVIPMTLAILVALFAIQRWGTHRVGGLFGPIMAFWFVTLAVAGGREVLAHASILKGLSPSYAVAFVLEHPGVAFVAMGAVVLAITGAEALYADMGHFGRAPILRAWFIMAFPALTLNYVLHESVVIMSAESVGLPHVAASERASIDELDYGDDGIAHVTARFGFQDEPNLPETLRLAQAKGLECDLDLDRPSYFLSRITIRPTDAPGMRRWRKELFVLLARNAASPADYFCLPLERTITLGSTIEL